MINLSFVITTFNKYNFLKVVLDELIDQIKSDEEIIVVDGGSIDGTVSYLEGLYQSNRIHKYVSEKDNGESDGFNKGVKMASGVLIKLLSDDDIYAYSQIAICKKYMLAHQEVDFLNTNGGWINDERTSISDFTKIYETFYQKKWLVEGHPFAHCCLGIMFRKASLEKVGYFSTDHVRADAEYSLRLTSSNVNFVWYTGVTYVRVLNNSSNSFKYEEKIKKETERLNQKYGFDIDRIYESLDLRDPLYKRIKSFLLRKLGLRKFDIAYKTEFAIPTKDPIDSFDKVYHAVQNWLAVINAHKKGRFLSR